MYSTVHYDYEFNIEGARRTVRTAYSTVTYRPAARRRAYCRLPPP
jgi:hypothetical protein